MTRKKHSRITHTPIDPTGRYFKKNKKNIILVLLFSFIISGVAMILIRQPVTAPVETEITPTVQPSATPVPSGYKTVGDIPDPNQKTYMSPELGIRFTYITQQNDDTIQVKRIAQKVYVFPTSQSAESGQWVEVYGKDPKSSIDQVIKTQFLKDYSDKDCTVLIRPSDNTLPGFIKAEIHATNENDPNRVIIPNTCPDSYTTSNTVRYFLMDNKHPGTLLFFNIGAYPIKGTNTKLWQDTIQVLR